MQEEDDWVVDTYPGDFEQEWTEGYRAAREGRDTPPPAQSQDYYRGFREGQDRYRMEHRAIRQQRHAHDVGARTTIQHCCFCGSGSVYARSDGAAQCDFCDSVFTVQLQPTHSGTPGTVEGQPYDPFEDGSIEDEDPGSVDRPGVVQARQRRLHAAWLESQNYTPGVPRRESGRLRR